MFEHIVIEIAKRRQLEHFGTYGLDPRAGAPCPARLGGRAADLSDPVATGHPPPVTMFHQPRRDHHGTSSLTGVRPGCPMTRVFRVWSWVVYLRSRSVGSLLARSSGTGEVSLSFNSYHCRSAASPALVGSRRRATTTTWRLRRTDARPEAWPFVVSGSEGSRRCGRQHRCTPSRCRACVAIGAGTAGPAAVVGDGRSARGPVATPVERRGDDPLGYVAELVAERAVTRASTPEAVRMPIARRRWTRSSMTSSSCRRRAGAAASA